MYILDVMCNRFYFGEVQEDVRGQCSGRVYQHLEKKDCLSITGWLRKCLCKYSTEVFKFVLEILGKLKFIASVIP